MSIRSPFTTVCSIPLLCALSFPNDEPATLTGPQTPNFVFILGEGQGYTATSVDMDGDGPATAAPKGLTPHLERLATEGMRLSNFHAGCPRCTPSRASFLTGVSPAKLHMTFGNDGNGRGKKGGKQSGGEETMEEAPTETKLIQPEPLRDLPRDVRTIANVLKAKGYATAHFGKWHVGRAAPAEHGFDRDDGANTNAGPGNDRTPNPEQCAAITDHGIEFIREQVKAGRPFYLQLSHYGGGSQEEATPAALARVAELGTQAGGKNRTKDKDLARAAVLVDMDDAIGRVLAALDELKIAGTTYVVFSTDHGSPGGKGGRSGPNAPLAGGKGSVREGGLRIPFLVRGPGVRKGAIATNCAIGWDLAPTFAELAGVPRDLTAFEGASLAGIFADPDHGVITRDREEIVAHFPHYDLDNGGPASAIFLGRYKLIESYETGKASLYDLSSDLSESHDLAEREPERTADLRQRLAEYLGSVDAQMAKPRTAGSESRQKKDGR